MERNGKARFLSSYQGESEYSLGGSVWRIRHAAHDDGHWNDTVYTREVRPLVGCVIAKDSALFHEFPPADVLACFPGFVGAKWTADYQVRYTAPPRRGTDSATGWLVALAKL